MRLLLMIATFIIASVSGVAAQSTDRRHVSAGTFFAFGEAYAPTLGIGATRTFNQGLTFGGGMDLVFRFVDPGSSEPTIFGSIVAGVQAPAEIGRTRFQPFLLAGLVLAGIDFGTVAEVGTHYWISRHIGVRTDIRLMRPFGGEGGVAGLRLGLSLR